MDLHPLAAPRPDEVWGPPFVLDLEALAADRAAAIAITPQLSGPPLPVARVEDVAVAGVPCRIVSPDPSRALPTVVYAHGGGWIGGAVATLDGVCRRLAVHGHVAVVSVEYRLAPEARWPAAVEDVDAVVTAVQAGEVAGCAPEKVAVAGDSAGGHLATIAARRARDTGRPVAHQALVYPVTDAVGITDGDPSLGLELGFSRGEMAFYWDTFLPDGVDRHLPDVSPLHANLAGMPTTTLLLAGHDILTPEGEAYARALLDAGVDVSVSTWPRMAHGFLRRLALFRDAVLATDQLAMALRHALHTDAPVRPCRP